MAEHSVCVEQEQFNLETLKVETLEPKSFFDVGKLYRKAATALKPTDRNERSILLATLDILPSQPKMARF